MSDVPAALKELSAIRRGIRAVIDGTLVGRYGVYSSIKDLLERIDTSLSEVEVLLKENE